MLRRISRPTSIWLRVSALGILFLLGYLTSRPKATKKLRNGFLPISQNSDGCLNFPSGANVVVSVKTGASEAAEKVPAQMQTTLRCAKSVLLFSDLEQDVEQYHLHDALNTVSTSIVNSNPDFIFYREQKALWQDTRDISGLKGAKNPESPDQLAAWTLDKYKFLHVLEKT
jgi:hypothetical protein